VFSYPSQLARGGDGELSPMGVCAALDVVHGVVRSYSDDASGMGAAVDLLLEQVRRWSKQRVIRSGSCMIQRLTCCLCMYRMACWRTCVNYCALYISIASAAGRLRCGVDSRVWLA